MGTGESQWYTGTSVLREIDGCLGNIAEFQNLSDDHLEKIALEVFLEDYSIKSNDQSLSRGFLDGLRQLVTQSTDVAQACQIVALAGMGNRLGRSGLVQKTKQVYSNLLHSFRINLSKATSADTVKSLVTAVLLGLYEVCRSVIKMALEF